MFWRNAKQNPNLISTIVRTYLALPTTTVCAQGCMISMNEPWSKNPLSHCPFWSEGKEKKGKHQRRKERGKKESSNSGLLKNANCRTWHCLFIYLIWNRWQYKGALDSWAFVCLQPSCLISFPSLHKDSNLSAKASFIVKRWGSESRGTSRAFK